MGVEVARNGVETMNANSGYSDTCPWAYLKAPTSAWGALLTQPGTFP